MDWFDGLWMTTGLTAFVVGHVLACGLGLALSVIDWREHRLPNRLVGRLALVTAATGLVGLALGEPFGILRQVGLGALAFGGPILLANLIAPEAMGFGDVKLGAVLGLWIGWHAPGLGLVTLLGAFVLALPQAIWRIVRQESREIAFGPYLLAAAAITVTLSFGFP